MRVARPAYTHRWTELGVLVSGDSPDDLPARSTNDEVDISVQPDGILVDGDPEAIESYLARLRTHAGRSMRVAGIDKASIGNATGLLAGAAAVLGEAGKFVQLHPDSVEALKVGHWIPGAEGFFRMTTRTADGAFLQQLQWRPAAIGPTQMMSLQMVAVQVALKSAIAEVEDAVRRVEGKVESLLQLANAARAGDVLGNHLTIRRAVDFLEKHGSLPDADWDAIASLGPALNVTVEQLRDHVARLLESFEEDLPVQDRAKKLRGAVVDNRLGETLSLLIVAEESLYKWQRIRLARVEAVEPQHLQRVIDDARELLAHQLAEDGRLYRTAKELLDTFAKPEAMEGFRVFAVRDLAKQRSNLREELDQFAEARRHQVEKWEAVETPSVLDAASAVIDAAMGGASKAIGSTGQGLVRFSEYLAEKAQKDASPSVTRDDT
ncbi:MAG: hypothetical protein JWR34_1903 [Mycobacterium sp.]|nr:hypothetical protein [Mycobacterium sp.]